MVGIWWDTKRDYVKKELGFVELCEARTMATYLNEIKKPLECLTALLDTFENDHKWRVLAGDV